MGEAQAGHNGAGVNGDQLRSYLERIERLEAEKTSLQADIREVYAETKDVGYKPKIMRKVLKLRGQDGEARREEAELVHLYARAVDLQLDLFAD